MKTLILIATILLLPTCVRAGCSYGTISVTGATTSCSITLNTTYNKYDVSVTRDASITTTETISVSTSSATDNLHFVIITNTSVYPTWVNVGSGTQKFQSVDAVVRSGTGSGEVVLLQLYTSGDLGANLSGNCIDVDQANTIQVGGDVLNPIVVGSSTSVTSSTLDSLDITGSLYSDVTASKGAINSLTSGGTIRNTSHIKARDGIPFVSASAIYGTIQTNYNGGTGDLGYLKTTSGDFTGSLTTHNIDSSSSPAGLDIAGDLSASITASGFRKPIVVGGNLDGPISVTGTISAGASITVGGSMRNNGTTQLGSLDVGATLDGPISVTGAISSGASITIGDSFRNNGTTELGSITVGSSGLAGQVIINANNSGGTWDSAATVTVGGTALSSTPYYTDTPASIGGGAVGLAPFHLHDNGCDPKNGGSINGWAGTATLTFYGPVTWGAGMPVLVYSRVGTGSWSDITADFTVSSGSNDRELVVTNSTPFISTPTTNYKIVPVTNAITCQDVSGSPSVVTFEYDLTN